MTMIFSRFGCELTIIGDCGEHEVKGFNCPLRLVRAKRADDGTIRHYFAHMLRADGGVVAIDAEIGAAPKVNLVDTSLKSAIEEAM